MRSLTVLIAAALLGACAAPPSEPQSAAPSGPPPATATIAAAAPAQPPQDARVTLVKAITAEIPEWFVNPPVDDRALYAAGTANSADLEFAVAKAILSAKRSLADRVGGSVSSRHKEYLQEASGHAEPMLVSDRATTNRITNVVLNGYTVVQTKLVPSDSQYRAFVLLQFPLGNVSAGPGKEAEPEAAQETKVKAARAFDELQRDIEAARIRNDVVKAELPPPPQP